MELKLKENLNFKIEKKCIIIITELNRKIIIPKEIANEIFEFIG